MEEFDWVFRGGRVFTGDDRGFIEKDVGVRGKEIAMVGNRTGYRADRSVQLNGRILSPGFIDLHSHSDLSLLEDGRGLSKLYQGVTTEVTGNCSMSPAPIRAGIQNVVEDNCSYMAGNVRWNWEHFNQYLNRLDEAGTALNIVPQVGHGTLRTFVVGVEDRPATSKEIQQMCEIASECFDRGASGLSTGLMYAPSSYASRDEIKALCQVVSNHNAMYSTHMRNEGHEMLDSIEETLEVTRETSVRTQISHLKAAGPPNWGDVCEAVERIERVRSEGYKINFDVYPYLRGSTQIRSLLPPFVTRGSTEKMLERLRNPQIRDRIKQAMNQGYEGWDSFFGPGAITPQRVQVGSLETEKNCTLQGKTLAEIASQQEKEPWDVLCDLLIEEKGKGLCVLDLLNENDVIELMSVPWSIVASDGLAIAPDSHWQNKQVHPRYYGCFPRFLRQYVLEKSVLGLEQALHKMTSLPAQQLGTPARGMIREGTVADLVVFDPDRIDDRATYDQPHRLSTGVDWLFVQGDCVLENSQFTEAFPGNVGI